MTYEEFVHDLWLKNCDERMDESLPLLTEEEYQCLYPEFLVSEFSVYVMLNIQPLSEDMVV
jgi:hypothetical protein